MSLPIFQPSPFTCSLSSTSHISPLVHFRSGMDEGRECPCGWVKTHGAGPDQTRPLLDTCLGLNDVIRENANPSKVPAREKASQHRARPMRLPSHWVYLDRNMVIDPLRSMTPTCINTVPNLPPLDPPVLCPQCDARRTRAPRGFFQNPIHQLGTQAATTQHEIKVMVRLTVCKVYENENMNTHLSWGFILEQQDIQATTGSSWSRWMETFPGIHDLAVG